MEKIRFIHCADLHLDSPFKGLQHLPAELFARIQNSTFAAFEKLVQAAIHEQVDFMVISGDLFDEEDRSIRAQARLLNQFNLLHKNEIPVYIIHGNHDYLGGFRLRLDMPDNIHVFSDETEVKELNTKYGAVVKITGFSYGTRHIRDRRISEYPKQLEADYVIGLLHGSEGSVHSEHESYAPFSISELKEKNYHYWALGHIHQRQILNSEPPIVYPGNIQGRHRKETGEKGCYLVELDKHDAFLTFIPTQEIIWGEVEVSLDGFERFGEIYQHIKRAAEEYETQCDCLLQIHIRDVSGLSPDILAAVENGDLLQALQADSAAGETVKWIHSIKSAPPETDIDSKDPFINDVLHTITNMDADEGRKALAELIEHPGLYRFLDPLEEEEMSDLVQEAVELILHPPRVQ
jgi:DNA repair protein SbcD/Mre11